jgi:hypothetical protein
MRGAGFLDETQLGYDILQMDKTGVQVLKEDGRAAKDKSFMWVRRGGAPGQMIVLYDYAATRAARCRCGCWPITMAICNPTPTPPTTNRAHTPSTPKLVTQYNYLATECPRLIRVWRTAVWRSPVRREQVALATAHGLSQRRACTLMKVGRSALRYRSRMAAKSAAVSKWMAELATQYPRYGYRRIHVFLGRDELVGSIKLRWRIERDYLELKQEVGLGHFEGRGWRGFHHHATL